MQLNNMAMSVVAHLRASVRRRRGDLLMTLPLARNSVAFPFN
jgi:hypothetical protein